MAFGPNVQAMQDVYLDQGDISSFQDLCSMLIVEEKTLLGDHNTSTQPIGNFEQQVFYTNTGRGRGRG